MSTTHPHSRLHRVSNPPCEEERTSESNVEWLTLDNQVYVNNFGGKRLLPIEPGRKLAVVTCMDSRIDPAAALGIKEGDAHVIRNAGGVAEDAIRSLIISQELAKTDEIAVIHHTECGMRTFTDDGLKGRLRKSYPNANTTKIDAIDFLPFSDIDIEQSVKNDVNYLKDHELIKKDIVISGWVYDVKTGKINSV